MNKAGIEIVDVDGKHMICFDEVAEVPPEVWNLDTGRGERNADGTLKFRGLTDRYADENRLKQQADDAALTNRVREATDEGWRRDIKDAAEAEGFDCAGLGGIAIVRSLGETWSMLREEVQTHRARRERDIRLMPKESYTGSKGCVDQPLRHRVDDLELQVKEQRVQLLALDELVERRLGELQKQSKGHDHRMDLLLERIDHKTDRLERKVDNPMMTIGHGSLDVEQRLQLLQQKVAGLKADQTTADQVADANATRMERRLDALAESVEGVDDLVDKVEELRGSVDSLGRHAQGAISRLVGLEGSAVQSGKRWEELHGSIEEIKADLCKTVADLAVHGSGKRLQIANNLLRKERDLVERINAIAANQVDLESLPGIVQEHEENIIQLDKRLTKLEASKNTTPKRTKKEKAK